MPHKHPDQGALFGVAVRRKNGLMATISRKHLSRSDADRRVSVQVKLIATRVSMPVARHARHRQFRPANSPDELKQPSAMDAKHLHFSVRPTPAGAITVK
jgi:hypothetical protein